MIYFKTEAGVVYAYENEEDRQEWGASGLVKMTQGEVDAHINPTPHEHTYEEELAILNSDYQKDVDALNRSWATALLADGPNEAVKLTAIRSQYMARKDQYSADYAALRNKYQK